MKTKYFVTKITLHIVDKLNFVIYVNWKILRKQLLLNKDT
jgi:hypothetical protein